MNLIDRGVITGKIAKEIADRMVSSFGESPEDILRRHPSLLPMTDDNALRAIVKEVVAQNTASVEDYKNGKAKALGFLVGQIMKRTEGKAPPKRVNELLLAAIREQ